MDGYANIKERLKSRVKTPEAEPSGADEPDGDEGGGDMEQKIIDAVTAAVRACFKK